MSPPLGQSVTQVTGRGVFVPGDDIDTDRVIPARFMKCVTFDGLGQYAFHDERFHEDGTSKDHPLDDPRFAGASVMVSGNNFGCGSSREHAPQALARAGIDAIVAGSFAEIFQGNCTTLGLVCVVASAEVRKALAAAISSDPQAEVTVDVAAQQVRVGDQAWPVTQPESVRDALLSGRWDPLAELRGNADAIGRTSASLPYL